MRWINKRNKGICKKAHRIVKKFIDRSWSVANSRHEYCNYSFFRKNKPFRHLLMKEQDGLCCYCMRRMIAEGGNSNVTYEHVMPHHVEPKDKAFYYARINTFRKQVRSLLLDYGSAESEKRCFVSPYPHYCAYENIVLSCNGSIYQTANPETEDMAKLHQTCNLKRGKKRVEPIFFYRLDKLNWRYERDGRITCDDRFDESVDVLDLENPTLVLMRKAWAELPVDWTTENVRQAVDNEEIRQDIVASMNLTFHEQMKLQNKLYWQIFSEYDWFDGYYRGDVSREMTDETIVARKNS